MNNINSPSIQGVPFQTPQAGKQVFGYLGTLNASVGYPFEACHYLGIDTLVSGSLNYPIDMETYQSIQERLNHLNVTNGAKMTP